MGASASLLSCVLALARVECVRTQAAAAKFACSSPCTLSSLPLSINLFIHPSVPRSLHPAPPL
eukprot:758993-Pleurochrysis_carterae.AAC.2